MMRRCAIRCQRRDQRGVVLIYVMAAVLLLGTVAVSILSIAFTMTRATAAHSTAGSSIRRVDAALEVGVQRVRTATDTAASCESLRSGASSFEFDGFTYTCVEVVNSGPINPGVPIVNPSELVVSRIVDVAVEDASSGSRMGSARISVTDYIRDDSTIGYEKYPGYQLRVCDWNLGRVNAAKSLGGCS